MPEPMNVKYTNRGVLGDVEVDGHDLTGVVARFSVDHTGGQAPVVFLELKKGVELDQIELTGYVHVRETVLEDPADAMLRFIEPLDAHTFEQDCLRTMELGGASTFGAAALDVLRRYAADGRA